MRHFRVVLAGVSSDVRKRVVDCVDDLDGIHDLMIWHGFVPPSAALGETPTPAQWQERKNHRYLVPHLVRPSTTRCEWGRGIGDASVVQICTIHLEADTGSKEEQLSKIEQLCREAGLPRPLQVWSGGKSVHAFWSLFALPHTARNAALWIHAQTLLAALVGSDPTAGSAVGHKMRLGGWSTAERDQYIIDEGEDTPLSLTEVVGRLELVAQDRGIAVKPPTPKQRTPARPRTGIPTASPYQVEAAQKWLTAHPAPPRGVGLHEAGKIAASYLYSKLDDATAERLLDGWAAQTGEWRLGEVEDLGDWARKNIPAPEVAPHILTEGVFTMGGGPLGEAKAAIVEVAFAFDSKTRFTGRIPKETGVYTIRWGLGAGKTQCCVEESEGLSVLVVTPSVRLAREAARRFTSRCYDEGGDDLLDQRLACCLPSLLRVPAPKEGKGYDLIVLDELDGLLDLLHSDAIMSRVSKYEEAGKTQTFVTSIAPDVIQRLHQLISRCLLNGGRIVAADAHLSDRALAALKEIAGGYENIVDVAPPPASLLPTPPRKRYPTRGALIDALLNVAGRGEKGTIACTTRAMVDCVCAMLTSIAQVPSDKICKITGATGMPPADEWDGFSWIVYNQAVCSGVSYDGPGCSSWLIGDVWGPEVHGYAMAQLQGRHRYPTMRHAWVADTHFSSLPSTEQEAKNRVQMKYGVIWSFTWRGVPTPLLADRDGLMMQLRERHEWYVARAARHPAGLFWSLCPATEEADSPGSEQERDLEALVGDVKKTAMKEEVERVMAAKDITGERCTEIERAVKAGQPVPAETLSEAARYRTYERWGILDIQGIEDTVRARSREHDAAQLFAACMAVSEGYINHIRHGERMRLRGGYRTSARGLEIKAICANVTVRHFGLDLKAMSAACEAGLNPLKGWPTLPIQTLKEITKGGPPIDPRLLRSLGLDQKAKETPMQYLQRILRILGLKAKGKKVRHPDGTRTRNYTLDLDAAQGWIERTSRYYTRATGRPVDAPESLHMWAEHPPEVYEALLPVPVKVVL